MRYYGEAAHFELAQALHTVGKIRPLLYAEGADISYR